MLEGSQYLLGGVTKTETTGATTATQQLDYVVHKLVYKESNELASSFFTQKTSVLIVGEAFYCCLCCVQGGW